MSDGWTIGLFMRWKKECQWCRRPIENAVFQQRFCCKKCRNNGTRERIRERGRLWARKASAQSKVDHPNSKTCLWCAEEFVSVHGSRHCSEWCRAQRETFMAGERAKRFQAKNRERERDRSRRRRRIDPEGTKAYHNEYQKRRYWKDVATNRQRGCEQQRRLNKKRRQRRWALDGMIADTQIFKGIKS